MANICIIAFLLSLLHHTSAQHLHNTLPWTSAHYLTDQHLPNSKMGTRPRPKIEGVLKHCEALLNEELTKQESISSEGKDSEALLNEEVTKQKGISSGKETLKSFKRKVGLLQEVLQLRDEMTESIKRKTTETVDNKLEELEKKFVNLSDEEQDRVKKIRDLSSQVKQNEENFVEERNRLKRLWLQIVTQEIRVNGRFCREFLDRWRVHKKQAKDALKEVMRNKMSVRLQVQKKKELQAVSQIYHTKKFEEGFESVQNELWKLRRLVYRVPDELDKAEKKEILGVRNMSDEAKGTKDLLKFISNALGEKGVTKRKRKRKM